MAHISLQKQVEKLINNKSKVEKLRYSTGKLYKDATDEVLKKETKRLRDCIQKRIDEYYSSYTPQFYERTYGLQKALSSNDFRIEFDGSTKFITIGFDENLSYGESVVTNGEFGYKPWLMDQGFKTPYTTPHFSGYKGFGFVQKGIEDWKANLKYNIKVDKSGWNYG